MDSDTRDDRDRTPAWQRSDDERQIDADAYHIWTPRPLIRSVYWRPEEEPPRDAVSGSYELFLDQRAFTSMHEHVWGTGVGESPFGYLVGDLCEDPTANRRFVIVTAVIPSRFPFREEHAEQITGEASVALQLEVERKRGVLVGWYHVHPTGEPILTASDVETHERLFPDPWQVAILFVTDPERPAGATFRRTPDGLDGELPLPFYEMVTNESLLAKGVRRSRVDWENVSTLDKVRAEPPPRPEMRRPDSAEPPAPKPEAVAASETGSDREIDHEPAVEPVPDSLPAVEEPGEASPETRPEELDDDLDFDALIAEVESAGLDVEESEFEEVSDPLSEVEDDLAAAEASAATAEESPGAASSPDEAPDLPGDEIPREVDTDAEADPPAEAHSEAGVDEADPQGAVAEVEAPGVEAPSPPSEEPVAVAAYAPELAPELAPEPASAPESPGGGRSRWVLPVIGVLIAIAVIAVLVRGFGSGAESDPTVTTDRAETIPAVQEEAPADAEASLGGTVGDPDAGAAAADPDTATAVIEEPGAEATPDPVSIEALRELSDSVVESISTFYGRSGAFDRGEIECPELQASFVEVMDSWIDYSTRGRAEWQGRMPPDVEERDERLYLGVQDVERLFEGSSCPRP